MEHLKAVFHEALADPAEALVQIEGGQIQIYEGRWAPHDLLKAIGDEAYEKEFRSWLTTYREQLLERGRELLETFDQEGRFNKLKDIYRNDAVVPFVGAGMSMPSAYPSWKGFLKKLRARTTMGEETLDAMLGRGAYEEAAQALADALGSARFNESMENTFGADHDLDGPVQLLPYIFKHSAITTNFDSVLKRCYEAAGCAFSETLLGTQAQEFPRLMATGKPFLTKLHGAATSATNRVLTKAEYDQAYADPKTLQRVIKTLCTRTLLFMGCSLTVDRLLAYMRDHIKEEGSEAVARHYAFLAAPIEEQVRHQRESELAEFNIYPIWYVEGNDSAEIESLLNLLADGVVSW